MISLATIKGYLGISDGEHDTLLQNTLEPGAIAAWERQGKVPIATAARTEILDGDATSLLWYRAANTADDLVLSVRESLAAAWTVVDAATYEEDRERRQIWSLEDIWTLGVRNYRAVFTTGYNEAGCPKDILLALLEMIAIAFQNRKVVSPAAVFEDFGEGGGRVSWSKNILGTLASWKAEAGLLG